MEMPASEIQADEASKDTTDRICAPGIKIRIRLPPRKRLSDGLQTMNTGVPEDTRNLPAKKVLEQTDNSTQSTAFTATKVKVEEANSSPSGEGVPDDTKSLPTKKVPEQINSSTRSMPFTVTKLNVEEASSNPSGEAVPEDTKSLPDKKVPEHTDNSNQNTAFTATKVKVEEANINNLSKTLSRDTLPEEANFMILSKKLTTTTGMVGKEGSSYIVGNVPCEEGNETILSKGLPPPNSRNTPIKESCVGATDNTPSKNLPITGVKGEVEKCHSRTRPCEDASNYVLSNKLLYETNSNTSSKGLPEEATINNPSKNLATSAVKREDVNDNSVGNSLVEEPRKNISAEKLSAEARNKTSSRRPTISANDKTYRKKLCTSVVRPTGTSHNTSGMKPFNFVGQAVEQSTSAANLEAIKEYREFEEKVRRTVYLDNLSPLATEAVIKMALNQFGSVRKVSFLVNYTVPYDIPQSALVEMETEKDAESVVKVLNEFPFMMSGMPRPVRGKRATAEMFNDRPRRPGSKLEFRWVSPTDPDYENARKFKLMSKRHEVESLALIKHQLEVEELLAKQQQDNLNCIYRKLEAVDTVILSGWVNRLSYIYNVSLDGVF